MENLEKKIPVHVFERRVGDSYQDVCLDFLNLKNLKKGDIFYECHSRYGKNYELKLKNNPMLLDDGIECVVETLSGSEIKIYVSGNTEYKSLDFYKIPQNLTKTNDNQFVYIIS